MDGLGESFGKLSTSAQEWRPDQKSSQQQSIPQQENENQHQHQQSDLNASSVKEFVPGKAWSTQDLASTLSKVSDPAPQEEQVETSQRHHGAASIPAGPTPSPLPSFRSLQSMGSDALWRYHRDLSLESSRQMDPTDPRHNAVPMPYYNAFCMDSEQKNSRSSSFGYPSSTFSTTSRQDGHLYAVRRFDNVRCVSPRIADAITKKWTMAAAVQEHPGVVPLYNCFVAQRAVFFVHQYIPGARTLRERLLEGPLHETFVWSAVNQIVSAVRAIHSQNLAVRALDLNHVLSNTNADGSRLRLRLNCLGVVDALEFEARKNPTELQLEDIRNLGFLVLSIATSVAVNSGTDKKTLGRCENYLANMSRELHGLTMTLIKSARPPSILEIGRALAHRTLDEQDAAYISLDRSEKALSAEYESGRTLRLMLKLAFVNERPEFGLNRRWAQSGDCYVLALFRDFVFHQSDGGGNPIMDLGHVTSALNKLDSADEEKVVLASRDGKSLMVVSYADVARCLESAFNELVNHSTMLQI